jgi:16S rRNA (guanine966-N2)-methyltransferase
MRIISGSLKGRQLVGFKAGHIRPTTDRVKETIFNKLMHDINGARVLDLFSGTGNLAIEAYSRGAEYVECVESHRTSLRIIQDNLKKLDISESIKITGVDVFQYLKSYKGEPFHVIFIDPPFTESWAHLCMESVAISKVAGPNTKVVIESSRQERIEDEYGSFHLLDRKAFGDKSASFFQFKE